MPERPDGGPGFFERLQQEAAAIASAPILSAVALLIVLAVMWGALHWSYVAALSNKDANIAFLERRLGEYRERLGGATPDEARRRIDTLEQEVRSLRVRLQPRRLSASQRQAIVDRSRLPAGAQALPLTVAYEANCSDCRAFAEALFEALRERGNWDVSTAVIDGPADRPRTGLAIRVEQPLRPPAAGTRLQQALRSAGLPFDMLPGGSGGSVELLVTERVAP